MNKKSNVPRHKRMTRSSRLQAAKHWIPDYQGKNLPKGYSKYFGVDILCSIKELELLGYELDSEQKMQLIAGYKQQQHTRQLQKQRRAQKKARKLRYNALWRGFR